MSAVEYWWSAMFWAAAGSGSDSAAARTRRPTDRGWIGRMARSFVWVTAPTSRARGGAARTGGGPLQPFSGIGRLTDSRLTHMELAMDRTDPPRHLPLNPRELVILASLLDGPLHGYGIIKAVEDRSDSGVLLDPANLYRVLRR